MIIKDRENPHPPEDSTLADDPQKQKDDFIMPRAPYRGEFTPERMVFNANLQEFANKVSLICNLETGGKISSEDAYSRIKRLWKELKASKKSLLDNSENTHD
ncbi:MAG: hypothetical protein F6K31_34280 [Symploca sp. SIO2G7]|nr:hypothetical protein [Symploca sp. SIO2G7]